MPEEISQAALSFFEASIEHLSLAVTSLGSTKRVKYQTSAKFAPEIGLIGASAELTMSGCIVQANGLNALKIPNTSNFKSFIQIHDEFKQLLRKEPENVSFLFQNLDQEQQINNLIDATLQFPALGIMRAAAFHAGTGLNHETTTFQANIVSDFLSLTGRSEGIANIFADIPRILVQYKERRVFIEDLAQRLEKHDRGSGEYIDLIRSIFLVFPTTPNEKPEWLDAFERLLIAPTEDDIVYLLSILEKAYPVSLRRVSPNNPMSIAVRYEPGNPNALPSEPHTWNKSFSHIKDRFYAAIGQANGRLENKHFHAQSHEEILELFSQDMVSLGILETNENLTAHDGWHIVASSLSYQGTVAPYLFIISKIDDLKALKSFLLKAAEYGNSYFKKNLPECNEIIDAMMKNHAVKETNPLYLDAVKWSKQAIQKKSSLLSKVQETSDDHNNQVPQSLVGDVLDFISGNISLTECAKRFKQNEHISDNNRIYCLERLIECTNQYEDRAWILEHSTTARPTAKTNIRKACRCIDFLEFAPK